MPADLAVTRRNGKVRTSRATDIRKKAAWPFRLRDEASRGVLLGRGEKIVVHPGSATSFNRPIRSARSHRSGTVVAPVGGMSRQLSATASMNCPLCGRRVAPTGDSTWVLAWYDCPICGHVWSARIRNGQPDMPLAGEACLEHLPYKERP